MKTVWTLNMYDGHFDYEIFKTREKAVEKMNEYKEAFLKNRFDVYHEDERTVILIPVPEERDQYLLNYTYKMRINEKVVY